MNGAIFDPELALLYLLVITYTLWSAKIWSRFIGFLSSANEHVFYMVLSFKSNDLFKALGYPKNWPSWLILSIFTISRQLGHRKIFHLKHLVTEWILDFLDALLKSGLNYYTLFILTQLL